MANYTFKKSKNELFYDDLSANAKEINADHYITTDDKYIRYYIDRRLFEVKEMGSFNPEIENQYLQNMIQIVRRSRKVDEILKKDAL